MCELHPCKPLPLKGTTDHTLQREIGSDQQEGLHLLEGVVVTCLLLLLRPLRLKKKCRMKNTKKQLYWYKS
jgi:hypothetical protein